MAGIFGLGEVRTEQINDTWPEDPNFGYFGGGVADFLPGTVCTIDRIDFSNETTSAPGNNFPQARGQLAAVSNSNYGYFGGGATPPITNISTIDRLDFSNETLSSPTDLPSNRRGLSGTSSSSYGYFCGGFTPPYISTITRLDFSNESLSNPTILLYTSTFGTTTVANDSTGYIAGGDSPIVSTINKLDFTTETVSDSGDLPSILFLAAGASSKSYGYFCGGDAKTLPTAPVPLCTITRLDFSSETLSNPGTSLPQPRLAVSASSNSNYGYIGGGKSQNNPPFTYYSIIDRLDFSNETVSTLGSDLPQTRGSLAAVSSGTTGKNVKHLRKISGTDVDGKPISNSYGYFAGGSQVPVSGPSWVNTIDRLDFSTETRSSPSNRLIEKKRGMVAVSSSNYGYIAGGWLHFTSPPAYLCTIERLDFSTETLEAPGTYQLTSKRISSGTVSNSNYGYFGGGTDDTAPPYLVCTIDRLDFSTETIQYPVIGHLTEARSGLAAVSTPEYGYFGGGSLGGVDLSCTIDRLDFSNETVDVPGTLDQLTNSRYSSASVYNSNYGYFAGGSNPTSVCTIERLDFSTETVAEPGSYQLTEARYGLAAVSNNSYGYFGGGYGPPWVCTIDRLDFSSETMQYPVTAEQLSEARSDLAGLSN